MTLPPIRHDPPDYLTQVAAAWHEAFQMVAPEYGQPESGIAWRAMPLSYKQCLRHVVQTLLERGTIEQPGGSD